MNICDWVTETLWDVAGDNLTSLLVYGPLVEEDHDAVKALSTLVLVLADTSKEPLSVLAEPLREATRRAHLTPYILRRDEVARLLDALPLRALTIRCQAKVLHGTNPFADVQPEREHVRLRVEQECRNLLIRLRHDICLAPAESHRLRASLWRTVRGITRVFEGLWFLKRGDEPHSADLWEQSAQDWDLSRDDVAELASYGTAGKAEDLALTAHHALHLLELITERADRFQT